MRLKHFLLATLLLGGMALPSFAQSQDTDSTLPPSVQDLSYDDYMSLGYNAQQEGRYSTAVKYFRNALYLNPDDRSAVVAYWNARDQLSLETGTITFDQYMNQGYDATETGDYAAALESFQNALALRPGNYYATQAIRNVQTYINSDHLGLVNPDIGVTSNTPTVASGLAPQGYLGETPYDRYMRLGYDATQREDYPMALSFFEQALEQRPNDYYATEAIENVRVYMTTGDG